MEHLTEDEARDRRQDIFGETQENPQKNLFENEGEFFVTMTD